jgi:CRP/FNR family transcriptional regulator, cyclic AMP receptor protein
MTDEMYMKVVAAVPLLSPLDASEIGELLEISKLIRISGRATIINEGDPAAFVYIIIAGEVHITKRLSGGGESTLAKLGPRDIFGELALIDTFPRSASAKTNSDCILYQVDLARFNQMRLAYRPTAFKILNQLGPIICTRLRSVNKQISRILAEPTDGRTARVTALDLMQLKGEVIDENR